MRVKTVAREMTKNRIYRRCVHTFTRYHYCYYLYFDYSRYRRRIQILYYNIFFHDYRL